MNCLTSGSKESKVPKMPKVIKMDSNNFLL